MKFAFKHSRIFKFLKNPCINEFFWYHSWLMMFWYNLKNSTQPKNCTVIVKNGIVNSKEKWKFWSVCNQKVLECAQPNTSGVCKTKKFLSVSNQFCTPRLFQLSSYFVLQLDCTAHSSPLSSITISSWVNRVIFHADHFISNVLL